MEKVLTVSVAAYNVESVIEKCLDSFCKLKHLTDIEVIVTDDGSKDRTAEIVQTYVDKHPMSIRLISKENGGHGSTINTAVSHGQGKYFKVVDGDDWIDAEALDSLIEFLKTTDADLIINDYKEVYPDHEKYIDLKKEYVLNEIYSIADVTIDGYLPMHGSTIKLSVYKALGLNISEHRFYVDTEYVVFLMLAAKTVLFRDECVYQYRLGNEGQSVSKEGIYKHIEDLIFVVERLSGIYNHLNRSEYDIKTLGRIMEYIASRYRIVFSWFSRMDNHDKDYMLKEFITSMDKTYPDIVAQSHLGAYSIVRFGGTAGLSLIRVLRKCLGR